MFKYHIRDNKGGYVEVDAPTNYEDGNGVLVESTHSPVIVRFYIDSNKNTFSITTKG